MNTIHSANISIRRITWMMYNASVIVLAFDRFTLNIRILHKFRYGYVRVLVCLLNALLHMHMYIPHVIAYIYTKSHFIHTHIKSRAIVTVFSRVALLAALAIPR